MLSKFDSVDSIVDYLRGSTLLSTVVDSTKKASSVLTNNVTTTAPVQTKADKQVLPKGRVKYGPITVNPRKQPSKTLFTGRRSKYEVLSGDEEEKRRDRRERNRVAATKCREKREKVLVNLENELNNVLNNHKRLVRLVHDLEIRKNQLEEELNNHLNENSLINNNDNTNQTTTSSMIFGDTSFLSSIIDAPPLPLPTSQQQTILCNTTDDEELSNIITPTPILTNSAYDIDQSDILFMPQPMTTSSIERLINNLNTPTISMESTTNNHSILFNSAVGSSCAKQHSNSSEDDSIPPKCTNPYVY